MAHCSCLHFYLKFPPFLHAHPPPPHGLYFTPSPQTPANSIRSTLNLRQKPPSSASHNMAPVRVLHLCCARERLVIVSNPWPCACVAFPLPCARRRGGGRGREREGGGGADINHTGCRSERKGGGGFGRVRQFPERMERPRGIEMFGNVISRAGFSNRGDLRGNELRGPS